MQPPLSARPVVRSCRSEGLPSRLLTEPVPTGPVIEAPPPGPMRLSERELPGAAGLDGELPNGAALPGELPNGAALPGELPNGAALPADPPVIPPPGAPPCCATPIPADQTIKPLAATHDRIVFIRYSSSRFISSKTNRCQRSPTMNQRVSAPCVPVRTWPERPT